jgi:glucans biosynthesis protein
VVQWSDGRGDSAQRRRFVLDFAPVDTAALEGLTPQVSATAGGIVHINLQAHAHVGGARLSFELDPSGASAGDLSAALMQGGRLVSEVWVHRWLT